MSNNFTIARVYAKAIFQLSVKQNNIAQWNTILELFSKIVQNNLLRMLCSNIKYQKNLKRILILLFEDCSKNKLDIFGKNLIDILIKNHRILLLPTIFDEFNNLYKKYVKSITIEIVSAHPLSNNQLKKITEVMTYKLFKTVNIVCQINKDILAGIIIKIEDTVIDGSLIGRISRLRNILQF